MFTMFTESKLLHCENQTNVNHVCIIKAHIFVWETFTTTSIYQVTIFLQCVITNINITTRKEIEQNKDKSSSLSAKRSDYLTFLIYNCEGICFVENNKFLAISSFISIFTYVDEVSQKHKKNKDYFIFTPFLRKQAQ